eukprot:scaffold977_cov253-Pinguiococcus_pyrenoidosus.AAC.35
MNTALLLSMLSSFVRCLLQRISDLFQSRRTGGTGWRTAAISRCSQIRLLDCRALQLFCLLGPPIVSTAKSKNRLAAGAKAATATTQRNLDAYLSRVELHGLVHLVRVCEQIPELLERVRNRGASPPMRHFRCLQALLRNFDAPRGVAFGREPLVSFRAGSPGLHVSCLMAHPLSFASPRRRSSRRAQHKLCLGSLARCPGRAQGSWGSPWRSDGRSWCSPCPTPRTWRRPPPGKDASLRACVPRRGAAGEPGPTQYPRRLPRAPPPLPRSPNPACALACSGRRLASDCPSLPLS